MLRKLQKQKEKKQILSERIENEAEGPEVSIKPIQHVHSPSITLPTHQLNQDNNTTSKQLISG